MPTIRAKIKLSNVNVSQNAVRELIDKSQASTPAMRAEIRRVFQMANRRIQNIENSGLLSPAVSALGERGSGFSKFSVKGFGNSGSSWAELRQEYHRAIAFLNDETSTATGARQYKKALQGQLGLQNEPALFEAVYEQLSEGLQAYINQNRGMLSYREAMERIHEMQTSASANTLEFLAQQFERDYQQSLTRNAREFTSEVSKEIKGLFK